MTRIPLPTVASRSLLLSIVVLLASFNLAAQDRVDAVAIEGQFVCSECWFEADRNTTPYGNAADIACAQDCAVKGIPPAIAVKEGKDFKLYLIQAGKFKKSGEEWLEYIGKFVRVSGRLHTKDEKRQVTVDEFTVLAAAETKTTVGAEAELTLKDLFGVDQKLSAYRGKIVVLNFWATWCIPCRKEMPDLAAIQNDYAALGVQVVGASADTLEDRGKVLQFIKDVRINFPVWLGAATEDMAQFGLGPALPATAVIGRDGKIVSVKQSVITEKELREQIDRLLAADAVALNREADRRTRTSGDASLVPS